jgi:hypothetical protein
LRIDVARPLRRIRPERHHRPLARRGDGDLVFAKDVPLVGSPLLLDAVVYRCPAGRQPPGVDALLEYRSINHLSVASASSLTVLAGSTRPIRPHLPALRELRELIADVPEHRSIRRHPEPWSRRASSPASCSGWRRCSRVWSSRRSMMRRYTCTLWKGAMRCSSRRRWQGKRFPVRQGKLRTTLHPPRGRHFVEPRRRGSLFADLMRAGRTST